MHITNC